MTFANPIALWLLLVIPPALVGFFWWSARKRQELLNRFIAARLLPGLTVGISPRRQRVRSICLISAVACLLIALARPQWGFDWEEAKQRGLDIVVAIDTSRSMLAEDIAPNRLVRAKLAALDLMQQAKSDRLGLVAFAGGAFLQCPMTIDDAAFRQSVETLDVNIIPQGGTALAEAIQTALSAFKESDNYKILVLFTDGEDQDSGALEAAEKAAKAGLRIFTIGIGSAEGELLRLKDGKGRTDYVRDAQGNVVKSHLNEELLQKIAGAANGFYLALRGAKTIDTLYETGLAPLPKSESKEKLIKRYHEQFHWPLALAIVLLLMEMLFPERKRIPNASKPPATTRPALRGAVAILALLLCCPAVFASSSSALRKYNAGKYDKALSDYEQLLQRNNDDPRLHYNAGTAAFRNQQLEEAIKQFDAAVGAPDLKIQQRAYYNRGNTLYHLGEARPDPAKRTESWEKSLKDFQSALKLDPQDADAKHNYEFVKKRLEELKQQQQQQQQDKNDSDKDKNQDQQQQAKNDQQQNSKDQQSQDQKQDQQQQEQKQDENKQEQANQSQQDQQQQDQQQQQAKNQNDKDQQAREEQQAKQSGEQKEPNQDEKEAQQAQAYAAGQMTPQQAQQLLDAQKGEEKMLPIKPTGKPVDRSRPIRDW